MRTVKIVGVTLLVVLISIYFSSRSKNIKLSSLVKDVSETNFSLLADSKKKLTVAKNATTKKENTNSSNTLRGLAQEQPQDEEAKVKQFLKEKTKKEWSVDKNNSKVVSIYGGVVKDLVNSDDKLKNFVTEMATAMGYDNISITDVPELKKKTEFEVINEFRQTIENVEIYGAYFRTFRDTESLGGSYFINEFKKYDQILNQASVEESDVKSKIDEYYGRLGKTVNEKSCGSKVYYVGDDKIAQLAYKCLIKAQAQLPEVYELVVSAASNEILYQKRITIYN